MRSKNDIIWLDSTESTNNAVRSMIDSLDNLSVVAALSQTAGRGQRGNVWLSEAGLNLTFSILLKSPAVSPSGQFAVSAATALSVTELLTSFGICADIKWPNDIYVRGRKICGMLIENSIKGNTIEWSIIGIGLNVNQITFPDSLPNPTSLLLNLPGHIEIPLEALLEDFMEIFKRYCKCFGSTSGIGQLRSEYRKKLLRTHRVHDCTWIGSLEDSASRH